MRKSILSDIIRYLSIGSINVIDKNNGILEALNAMPIWHIATC